MLRSSRQRPCAWPVVIRSCAKFGYFLCTQIGHKIEWENYLRILWRVRCQKKRGKREEATQWRRFPHPSIQPTLSTRQRLLNEVADVGDTWSSFQVISSCVLMLPASLGKCSPLSLILSLSLFWLFCEVHFRQVYFLKNCWRAWPALYSSASALSSVVWITNEVAYRMNSIRICKRYWAYG